MSNYLFSYGTLQQNETQLKLFGRLLNGTKDVLKGYKTITIEITDQAFLAKGENKFQRIAIPSDDPADEIEGTALEFTEEELLRADQYEPKGYGRKQVTLASGKKAWIYGKIDPSIG